MLYVLVGVSIIYIDTRGVGPLEVSLMNGHGINYTQIVDAPYTGIEKPESSALVIVLGIVAIIGIRIQVHDGP